MIFLFKRVPIDFFNVPMHGKWAVELYINNEYLLPSTSILNYTHAGSFQGNNFMLDNVPLKVRANDEHLNRDLNPSPSLASLDLPALHHAGASFFPNLYIHCELGFFS
jgi:hypothetical protein